MRVRPKEVYRRQQRKRRRRRIRKIKTAAERICTFAGEHPVKMALPLIIFMVALLIDMSCFSAKLDAWEQEQAETMKQTETMEQEETQQDMTKIYGCKSLYGVYEYPWNTMSQDWSGEQVEGFFYHEISDSCKAAGGSMPTIIQVYTYIICQQYGVDYEMTFALIERESLCKWDAAGDGGSSVGLMQVAQKWHEERMKDLGVYNLMDPFQNVKVGVDYLAEIQKKLRGTVPDEDLSYYVLAAYNYGMQGARRNLWDQGVVKYSYNTQIMERAKQLKEEKQQALEGTEDD